MTKTNVALDRLKNAVESFTTSENWLAWLRTKSRFHNYSFRNCLLIYSQCPEATRVAGYKTWQSLGRHVRKGEKGIAILAPSKRKITETLDDGTEDERVALVGFRTVYVFDVSQTDGEALPEIVTLPDGEVDEIVEQRLRALAESEGLSIEHGETGSANGWIDRPARKIRLSTDLTNSAARVKTLAHELGHWFDLGDDASVETSRADAEIVAEATAFVICDAYELDTSDYSAGYVTSWAQGDAERLSAVAERIDTAASKILDACEVDSKAAKAA